MVDVDRLLSELEVVRRRWRGEAVPPDQTETYAECGDAIDDLYRRLEELLSALDNQELERLRVCSQAVEVSGQRLAEKLDG